MNTRHLRLPDTNGLNLPDPYGWLHFANARRLNFSHPRWLNLSHRCDLNFTNGRNLDFRIRRAIGHEEHENRQEVPKIMSVGIKHWQFSEVVELEVPKGIDHVNICHNVFVRLPIAVRAVRKEAFCHLEEGGSIGLIGLVDQPGSPLPPHPGTYSISAPAGSGRLAPGFSGTIKAFDHAAANGEAINAPFHRRPGQALQGPWAFSSAGRPRCIMAAALLNMG